MKSTRLFIAALALMGVAACGKMAVPEEEPVVAPEPEQTVDVKSVAATLDEAAEIQDVRNFIKDFYIEINKAEVPWHLEFCVAPVDEDPYISGILGLAKGENHPVVIDMDILVMNKVSIAGTLDLLQVTTHYAMAKHVKSEMALEYHLAKASEGIDLTVMGVLRFQFMTGEDEECNPTMGLYLYNPEDLSYPPVPVAKFFDLFFIK